MSDARCISCHKAIPPRGGDAKFCSSHCRTRTQRFAKNLEASGVPSFSSSSRYQTTEEQQASTYSVQRGKCFDGRLGWYVNLPKEEFEDTNPRRYEVPRDFDPEIARGGEVAILMEIARRRGEAKPETPEVEAIEPDLHLGNVLGAIHAATAPSATSPTPEHLAGFIDGLRALQEEAGMRVTGVYEEPITVRDAGPVKLASVTSLDKRREARDDRSSVWEEVDMPWE